MKRLILALAMVVMVSPAWGGELDGKVIECKSLDYPDGSAAFYEFKNNSVHRYLFAAHYSAEEREFFKVDPKTLYTSHLLGDYTASQSVVRWIAGYTYTLDRRTLILAETTGSQKREEGCTVISHSKMRERMRQAVASWKKIDQEERNKNKI